MEKLIELTEEQKKYAIDLAVTLVVEELSEELHQDASKILKEFIDSKTGRLLYDESSKLWWDGPTAIAQMYKKEKIS